MKAESEQCSICFQHDHSYKNDVHWKLKFCVPEWNWNANHVLCIHCSGELDAAYNFRTKCLKSQDFKLNKCFGSDLQNLSELSKELKCEQQDFILGGISDAVKHVPSSESQNVFELTYANDLNHVKSASTDAHCHSKKENLFEKPNSDITNNCNICSRSFKRAPYLNRHQTYCKKRSNLELNKNKRKNVCAFCGKTYLRPCDMKNHEKLHQNLREYECSECMKKFNSQKNLYTHRHVVHTDPMLWKYICPHCGKRFPLKPSYELHVRRHLGDKRHACHFCGKLFVDVFGLRKHVKTHSNVKAFKCEHCAMEYKAKKQLEIHLKRVHGIGDTKVPIRIKKHFCKDCPKSYFDKNKLDRHTLHHTGERPFNCHICKCKFKDKSYVRNHLQIVHKIVDENAYL